MASHLLEPIAVETITMAYWLLLTITTTAVQTIQAQEQQATHCYLMELNLMEFLVE